MKPEKRRLLHDVLDEAGDNRRAATLVAGGRLLRRKRGWRTTFHALATMMLLVLAGVSFQRSMAPRSTIQAGGSPVPATSAQGLTDAELLALFPETPVGLATLENGRKQLIFPRPGDEDRFIKRM